MPAPRHVRACHRAGAPHDTAALIFDCWAIFFIRWSWIARWKWGVPASSHSFSSHECFVLRPWNRFLLAPLHEALISNYFWDIKTHNRCCRALEFPWWLWRERKGCGYNSIVISPHQNVNYWHSFMIICASTLMYQTLVCVICCLHLHWLNTDFLLLFIRGIESTGADSTKCFVLWAMHLHPHPSPFYKQTKIVKL